MTIATTPEQRDLAAVVATFVGRERLVMAGRRALQDGPSAHEAVWKALAQQGWIAIPVPEEYGGAGFTLAEAAVVVHGLGAGPAPGALVPTLAAAVVIAELGTVDQCERWLPALCDGTETASVALGDVSVGAVPATVHLICRDGDVHVHRGLVAGLPPEAPLDPALGCVGIRALDVLDDCVGDDVLAGAAARLTAVLRTLAACEAAGGAERILDIALEHAKTRSQFGRVIGGFQAIKHHLADMRMRSELAVAAAWGAARLAGRGPEGELAAAVAASVAVTSYELNARKAHQILGGMGFTWEHDAHLHLRRSGAWVELLGAGSATDDDVQRLFDAGVVPDWQMDLPAEADDHRRAVQEFITAYQALPEGERRRALVDSGYLVPHWPTPWGRAAGPIEQLVIEESIRELRIPDLDINGWVLLTLVHSATPEQLDRWILPGLMLERPWCQMFSEPEAGSDAAAVRTRGVRTDGGWIVSGQKMWTTDAHESAWGMATVRTDPDAPKHRGITMMAIDLAAPGVTVRPIREMTGLSTINEVFLDDVFVPAHDVVGVEGGGWDVARATLGNERVSIGGRRALGHQASDLVELVRERAGGDVFVRRELGRLLARETAMQLIGVRQVESLLAHVQQSDLGPLTKVLSSEHLQAVTELGIRVVGILGDEPQLQHEYLFNRCLTIAGGSSEIGRNVVAERLLGLPREIQPAPGTGVGKART